MRYEPIWDEIRDAYLDGMIVSERDLQTHLICRLRAKLPSPVRIVAEPTWSTALSLKIPDIVIAKNGAITDIFELKFVPHGFADAKVDIRKLVEYARDANARWPITILPDTGQWTASIPMDRTCQFHFAVISNYEAEAVWPENFPQIMPDLASKLEGISIWYGRVRPKTIPTEDWGIKSASSMLL